MNVGLFLTRFLNPVIYADVKLDAPEPYPDLNKNQLQSHPSRRGNAEASESAALKCSARYLAEQNSEIQELIPKPDAGNSNCFRSFSCKVVTE